MEHREVPGLAIAVLRDGKTVYRQSVGVLDLASREPVTANTRFHLASVTKTFVATAVLQMAEQGMVDLDAHPHRYLPYFQPADPRAERITLRQLLAHTSGLQKDDDTRFDNPEFDDGALERLVREAASRPLDFAPGEKFGYSNLGYCVLGDIVAKVSGETFERYVKRHLLEPLRMKDSTLLLSEAKGGPWARPYVVDDTYTVVPAPFHPYNRRRAPSNAMSSTLSDLERWARVHLNRGELEGRRILKSSTYDEMWRPAGESLQQIGLGWFLWKRGAERVAGHNGSDTGFVADVELLPDRGIGVIVLCNLDHGPYRPLMLAALDAALGKTPDVVFKPSLARDLFRVVAAQGAEAAVARYREIRREQAGRYDFSEWVSTTWATSWPGPGSSRRRCASCG
jgi:CubicO group peptidase (beta-lactamase class C family)